MQKHSVTLCLSFQDHEEVIGRTLKSALAAVDEVVAVDLGAKDNTRLIVEGYGARVIDTEWSEDTAAARNAALAAAYGDWILVMEPGEILEPAGPVDLGRLLADKTSVAYYLRVCREQPEEGTHFRDELRLFRNDPRVRYRYRISPQIAPALEEFARLECGSFRPSSMKLRRPLDALETVITEDLRRLKQLLQEFPEEPWYPYRLARATALIRGGEILPVKGFESVLGRLEEAARLLQQQEEEGSSPLAWGGNLLAALSQARRAAGRAKEAVEAAEQGLERCGDSSRLRFEHAASILTLVEQRQNPAEDGHSAKSRTRTPRKSRPGRREFKRAVKELQTLLEGPRDIERIGVDSAHFQPLAHVWLGRAALLEGEVEGARAHFYEALDLNPAEASAWCGLARAAAAEGRERAALQIFLKALDSTQFHAPAWKGGIEVLGRLGFVDNAWSWMQRFSLLLPEYPGLRALEESLLTRRREETAGI